MNLADLDLNELQSNDGSDPQHPFWRWTDACFQAWLQRHEREARAQNTSVESHLSRFARFW